MAKAPKKTTAEETFTAYKGFDKNLVCHPPDGKPFQYEIGKTYRHEGTVKVCHSGFHVCPNPIDILDYYPLIAEDGSLNRFGKVTVGGEIKRDTGRKWAVGLLTFDRELSLSELIDGVVKYALSDENASSGDCTRNVSSGDFTRNVSSGHSTQNASSGYGTQNVSSGDFTRNASSGHRTRNASSGDCTRNVSSGDYARNASSGDYGSNMATGQHSVIAGAGRGTRYRGAKGTWISAADYAHIDDEWRCTGFAVGCCGHDIPADTWLIVKDGKLVEAQP